MKQKTLIWAVVVLLVMNVFTLIGWNKSMDDVQAYHQYYMGAEELLDTLENHYNWIDAIDNDAYYDAVSELNNK
jgi:uncharacterized lipoprotein NlpE involved in copper resistance